MASRPASTFGLGPYVACRGWITAVFVIACIALAASPAIGAKVNTKYSEDTDFSSFETFAWKANAKRETSAEDAPERAEVAALARRAIEEELQRRGFSRATGEAEPDFLVSLDGSMQEVFDVEGYHKEITSGVAFVMEGDAKSYRLGTLMIRILDGATGEVVWTAWTSEKIRNPEKPEKQLRKGVRKLLRRFPPGR